MANDVHFLHTPSLRVEGLSSGEGRLGIRENRLDRAAGMPHRSIAGDDRLDDRLASEIGRLYFGGFVTKSEYEAGVRYANIVLLYLRTTDAPSPYGTALVDLPDDVCFRRKVAVAAARTVLRDIDERCIRIVDRVTVYEEPLREGELNVFRSGLRALAGTD